jgi:4-hydroxybenzoate polyprenyltransferase
MRSEAAEAPASKREAASASRRRWTDWLGALRPKQFTKNLILFAALVFGGEAGSAKAWLSAGTAFVAYCAASSAAYLVNDVVDREADRAHPLKQRRAVARAAISPGGALVAAALLAAFAVGLAALLGAASLAYMAGFLALQAAYTLALKRVALVDVAAIAGLFVIRAGAGAAAVDVAITAWLLACTALLAAFLTLAKRRAELVLRGDGAGRGSLRHYSLAFLDRALVTLLAVTLAVYLLYAVVAHPPVFLLTVPLVAYGLCRYLTLVRREGRGEEPESVLLSDRRLLAAVACWAVLAGALVYAA